MLFSRYILHLALICLVLSLLIETGETARKRRRKRRRRRNRIHEENQITNGGRIAVRRLRNASGRSQRDASGSRLPDASGSRLPDASGRRLRHASGRRQEFIRRRLRRFRNRNRDYDGKIRLVDGRAEYEGNVEIYHDGRWGNICDDEWDLREGEIVCKRLGFPDVNKVTYSGLYGQATHEFWLDNLFCYGNEKNLSSCKHDGWGKHDCERDEAAGVVCMTHFTTTETPTTIASVPTLPPQDTPVDRQKIQETLAGKQLKLNISGGRVPAEGKVAVQLPGQETWGLICGDGWSLLEAAVVCRQLGLGYAQSAPSTGFFGGNMSDIIMTGVKCRGNEETLDQCLHEEPEEPGIYNCPAQESETNIAGVTCVDKMADLIPDVFELSRSVHLEDKQLFFLQCAMEENCLASTAYQRQETGYGWHLETRRLLRFTARIANQGTEAFLPFLPKNNWEFHHCHMHYHSMEVFAHYDIIDSEGKKVAEGHKASFCLEDNNCLPDVQPYYNCANFGDQGISPGCTDTYAYNIDCQWVDITDLDPGEYTFKLSVNPDMKVGEQSFENNAAHCSLLYTTTGATITNCSLTTPSTDRNVIKYQKRDPYSSNSIYG